jgi:hypothetical protein
MSFDHYDNEPKNVFYDYVCDNDFTKDASSVLRAVVNFVDKYFMHEDTAGCPWDAVPKVLEDGLGFSVSDSDIIIRTVRNYLENSNATVCLRKEMLDYLGVGADLTYDEIEVMSDYKFAKYIKMTLKDSGGK